MTEKNWQRLKNLAIFKVWATDKELRPLMPWVVTIALVIIIIGTLRWLHG